MAIERNEVLVLGSGAGGKLLSWHMARAGRRTAVVERKWIGGSCPNVNCLPSKNEIWSAKVADLVHHATAFGMVTGTTAIDMRRVRKRKREMVDGLITMHLDQYRASGAELIMGMARFLAPKTVEVHLNDGGTRVLAGERVFLNLGTCHDSTDPRSGGCWTAHEHRVARARPAARASRRSRRRLCRPRICPGVPPLRKSRDRYPARRTASRPRGC